MGEQPLKSVAQYSGKNSEREILNFKRAVTENAIKTGEKSKKWRLC